MPTLMGHQDWTPVVLNQRVKNGALSRDSQVNVARRRGENVESIKKFTAGQNKTGKQPVPNAAKLDEDTGDYHIERVSHTFAQALQQARMAKKWTQAQLAQQINEKASLINDYERGSAIPNGQIVARLNRALGVRLPPAKDQRKTAAS